MTQVRHDTPEWHEAMQHTIQKSWQHPQAPGMIVTRVFEVTAPTERMALKTAHVHFLLALNGLGIRFRE